MPLLRLRYSSQECYGTYNTIVFWLSSPCGMAKQRALTSRHDPHRMSEAGHHSHRGVRMQSALSAVVRVQVSSVLNRDTASYGKQHLVDRNDQTCWNSDQGLPQSITVTMSHPVDICGVRIVFQGGFVGSRLQAWVKSCGSDTFALQKEFDAEDRNGPQDFLFDVAAVERIKIVFTQSSDFFGRITIYHLDILTSTPPTEPA